MRALRSQCKYRRFAAGPYSFRAVYFLISMPSFSSISMCIVYSPLVHQAIVQDTHFLLLVPQYRDKMEVFEANGFTFVDDVDGLKLSTVPTSKNITFGPKDVAELAIQLQEGGSRMHAIGKQQAPQRVITQSIPRPSRYFLSGII